jgi:hypothetical protein
MTSTFTGDINFDSDTLVVDSTNNKVGIGTSSPSTYGGILNLTDGSVGGETNLVIANNNANQFIRLGIYADEAQISYDNADALVFGETTDSTTSGITTERMKITSGGNVGIGTSSPSQKLDVNGTINATAFTGDGSALTGISAGDIVASSVGTSNNSNGYVKFSNNLVIQWLRKSSTGTQTITYPLAMNNYYGVYTSQATTGNAMLRIHSIGTSSVTVGNADGNILGWLLVTGRKT